MSNLTETLVPEDPRVHVHFTETEDEQNKLKLILSLTNFNIKMFSKKRDTFSGFFFLDFPLSEERHTTSLCINFWA